VNARGARVERRKAERAARGRTRMTVPDHIARLQPDPALAAKRKSKGW